MYVTGLIRLFSALLLLLGSAGCTLDATLLYFSSVDLAIAPSNTSMAYRAYYAKTGRYAHTSSSLANGKVLIVGGTVNGSKYGLKSVEIFDPETQKFADAANFPVDIAYQIAVTLNDGRVLVAGGGNSTAIYSEAYIYNPANNTWTQAASMSTPRMNHAATLLNDGRVLVSGGLALAGDPDLSSAEIYDPSNDTWTAAGNRNI